jgi:mannan endo-1,4-beta-mannosidase
MRRPPAEQQLSPYPINTSDQKKTKHRNSNRIRRSRTFKMGAALVVIVAIALVITLYNRSSEPVGPLPAQLPPASASYLGVYAEGVPYSYSQVKAFANATGARPDVVMYYSGWFVPFPLSFAATVAGNGAVPLVQMNPDTVSAAAIAAGRYDGYLSSYAEVVRAYKHPVIIGFGHEMNGNWSPWGYRHTSPRDFVAAWRHIVNIFKALDARNVTWLWTVNIINDPRGGKVDNKLSRWWPGNSYVTWVGIDGYYLKPSWQFAPLFGPTIAAVRTLTTAPILISETGAISTAQQPANINNLFAGIRSYGLLGFVYFNQANSSGQHFGINSPAAIAAFRKNARTYRRPDS